MATTTIEIKRKEFEKVKDVTGFFTKLNEVYEGKWVVILKSGELIANKSLGELYSTVEKQSGTIETLFFASKNSRLLFK